ncbi:MAG: PGPGW domain-containing protein [Desulforhopalus sp.]
MIFPVESLAGSEFLGPLLGWLALISLLTFVLSLILIPLVVGKLSQNCFLKLYDRKSSGASPSIGSLLLLFVRNIFGMFLLFAGILMLFLPGQGLLTILLGGLLISFPGKRKLLLALVCKPKIQHSLDWLRKKMGKPPFLWPNPE